MHRRPRWQLYSREPQGLLTDRNVRMDSLQPCSIVHVDTSGQMPIGRMLPENAPAYAILWWRDVPLTHACVQQTAVGSDRQFLEHVFERSHRSLRITPPKADTPSTSVRCALTGWGNDRESGMN